jgi:hypothetical protein
VSIVNFKIEKKDIMILLFPNPKVLIPNIGGQYRVLGKHLLELFDEGTQEKAKRVYSKTKSRVKSWE